MRFVLATLICAAALSAVEPGQRAPGFALMNARGDGFALYDFRGKPVIIEFMQTTCPHCASFTTVLAKVQAKFGERVGILAIANPPDNPNTGGRFLHTRPRK